MKNANFKSDSKNSLLGIKIVQGHTVLILFIILLTLVVLLTGKAEAMSETSRTNHKLSDGVYESTLYVTEPEMENVRVHILRINRGAGVKIKATAPKYYKKNSTKKSRKRNIKKWKRKDWGITALRNQVSRYQKSKDTKGKVIAAVNGDYYKKEEYNGATEGPLIIEGNQIRKIDDKPFFAVLKNGRYRIRKAGGRTYDVQEAVGGHLDLVREGKLVVHKNESHPGAPRHECQAIGLTKNKDIIVATVDGEEPTSLGMSWYNLGKLMKQQGCYDAIMLDGGGSATFMTRRSNGGLMIRNNLFDGMYRDVSSSILVVQTKKNKKKVSGKKARLMVEPKTKFIRAKNGIYKYRVNGKAGKSGVVNVNGSTFILNKNGDGITKEITIGKTKYFFVKGALQDCTDKKAGKIAFGYCGGADGGQNLIYAYHYGDGKLNIGMNPLSDDKSGRMKNWKRNINVPWYSKKLNIKSIHVADGVENVGSFFMCIELEPFNDYLKGVRSSLEKVRLPSSVRKIGKRAFYNHYYLQNIVLPENVDQIMKKAFFYNNGTRFIFKGKTPPSMSTGSFIHNSKTNKKGTIIVPNTEEWVKHMTNTSTTDRIGFMGIVQYQVL